MELEKLLTNLLDRLDRIDEEGKGTIIEDKINKLSHQIGQLKSDLSDVATLFDLLKDNKEQIVNKISDTSKDFVPLLEVLVYRNSLMSLHIYMYVFLQFAVTCCHADKISQSH